MTMSEASRVPGMNSSALDKVEGSGLPSFQGISAIEKRMMSLLGPNKSPWEVSEELNGIMTPIEVHQRSQEILNERNWLSVLQLKMLMMDEIWRTFKKFAEFSADGSPKAARAMLDAAKELRVLMDQDTETIQEAMLKITNSHAERMGQAIAEVVVRVLSGIEATDEQAEKADVLVLEVVPEVVKKLDDEQ
jgi:type III secretion system FlhB-like substrate exporter